MPEDRGIPSEVWSLIDHPSDRGRSGCGPGWSDLIVTTHRRLLEIDPTYSPGGVRQKLGWLDFQLNPGPDTDQATIERLWAVQAEVREASKHICESCGGEGRIYEPPERGAGRTRCDACESCER